jgi:hypothetical protein
VKEDVLGGLDQMSVEEGAFMMNSAGGVPFPGTGLVVLAKWKSDMVVVVMVDNKGNCIFCMLYILYGRICLVFEAKRR